ncbi:MAG: sulfatase-like hydrolase/transferase [Pseudomonadales bacterium]|nr:sulfatase-like hydrolase/transferase [Pseudomonadales bacterium]
MRLQTSSFLGWAVGVALYVPALGAEQPNMVLIVADDLGYPDICAYGCTSGRTPHIDSLAERGVRFTDGYVSAPICSPSRAGMLTGRYQQRFGHEFNAGGQARSHRMGLGTPASETLLPAHLKAAGYATGMSGKWHLGSIDALHPLNRGFDEFFGFLHGANAYFDSKSRTDAVFANAKGLRGRGPVNPILRGHEPVDETEYLTDALTREAVSFIERHAHDPFFLYVPYNAPHTPLEVTRHYYDRFPEIEDHATRVYKAMISAVDDGVGAIISTLEAHGIADDTLVIFTADNGCAIYTGACTNAPLFHGKLLPFEGGVRVPFLAAWPNGLPAGRTVDTPVSTLDIVPTAIDLAGVPITHMARQRFDGVNFVDLVNGPAKATKQEAADALKYQPLRVGAADRPIFWRNQDNAGVRLGQWKLVRLGELEFLFDLSTDIGEATNLIEAKPDVAAELRRAYDAWAKETRAPLWPPKNIAKVPVHLPGIGDRVIDTAI